MSKVKSISTHVNAVDLKRSGKTSIPLPPFAKMARMIGYHATKLNNRIFVYRFSESNVEEVNKLINSQRIPAIGQSAHLSETKPKRQSIHKRPIDAQRKRKMAIAKSQLKTPYVSENQRWAVRVEGLNVPEKRNFGSRNTALAFAKNLSKKLHGYTIVNID